ncbi:MAG: glycosyltransferase [Halothiobacillus sp.]|jgi:glycosyltransferase involved in cell wall biosynthesis|nr:glycosyltransferase [Halothiobacillus sp.]
MAVITISRGGKVRSRTYYGNGSDFMMSTRKSVVHLVTSLDFGGVEKHIEIIAKHSQDMQYPPTFCAIAGGGVTEKSLREIGVKVVCLGLKPRIPNFQAVYKLTKFFLNARPLIVHTHGAEANFHGLLAAMIARVPVRVGEEIGIPSHSGLAKLVFAQVYKTAHRVIGISDSVTNWLVESGEVKSNRAVRLYNPVLLPTQKLEFSKNRSIFRMGFVGRLEPVKNPMVLLEVLKRMNEANILVELRIVGDGSLRRGLEDRVDEYKLRSQVTFFGYQDDPYQFIRDCDLYLQPSISEGFGLAVVEAMGCGIPVIATAVGGVPEIIQDGITGWIVETSDAALLTEAVMKALKLEPNMLFEIGKSARKSIESRFEPKKYISDVEKIYQSILSPTNQTQSAL